MSYATEIEITKVLNVEVTSVEDRTSGICREILIESENGNLRIKLYANNDKAEIQVLI
jgi:hypothetical protein